MINRRHEAPFWSQSETKRRRFTEINNASIRRFVGCIQWPVMGSAPKRGLEERPVDKFSVPSYAPIEFVCFTECDGRSDMRTRRQEKIKDAIFVSSREAPAQHFEINRRPALMRGVVNRLLETTDADFIDCPKRMICDLELFNRISWSGEKAGAYNDGSHNDGRG